MADEHISYLTMVNCEVDPMAYTTHRRDFGLCSDRPAPGANGVRVKLARLARRLSDASAAERQREVDREIVRVLARSGGRITDGMEREIMQSILASDWRQPR